MSFFVKWKESACLQCILSFLQKANLPILHNFGSVFDDFVFGARRRSVYQDTRAGKDFMLKRTPELKNIPPEHHFLFSMENLMGRVKQALNMKPDPDVPKLDGASYDANYRLGVTTEYVQKEEEFDLF
mgnify:CR=1 FL=1